MIVADFNLIAYLVIRGGQTPQAEAVLRRDPAWAAPVLWRSEFRNILALYLRQKHFSLADALRYMREAEALLHGNEYQVESDPVLALADQSGRSAYDCEFVHLAQDLGVQLVTADRQVLRSFPSVAISMEDFVK
ncbi:MAG TPA: type II toxin-antitoxin system VapC family toxin [Longimicrobium sp.]|nr:type II toxin-antitoxin system VapC family toxin [Longimicrobium sp.]